MAKGWVTFQEELCKGCELCTTACPQDVLVMDTERTNSTGYHPAILLDPDQKCTGCALCAVICPDVVITVHREPRRAAA